MDRRISYSLYWQSIRYRWFVREGDGYGVWEKGNALRTVVRITAGFPRNTPSPGGPNTPRCGVVVGRHGCLVFLPFCPQLRLWVAPSPFEPLMKGLRPERPEGVEGVNPTYFLRRGVSPAAWGRGEMMPPPHHRNGRGFRP